MLGPLFAASALAGTALAQSSAAFTPLAAKHFEYDNLPYQADTSDGIRGHQLGYNRCNSSTENQDSLCQTAIINSIDDFCLWAPPRPNETVGDIEGEMVAWCTKEGHGTRLIPQGALQGVQFIRTPHYVQVVGFINQVDIDMMEGDYGGEMDPHGADQRGNPLGGLIFSDAFNGNSTTNGTAGGQQYQQVIQMSLFCLKACDPSYENGWAMCEHIYDRIGCKYNAPSEWSKINGTFESCKGDDQLYPGQYIENGQTMTYTQPPESLGPITSIPYTPYTPPSSECTQYTSSNIYTAGPQLAASTSAASSASESTSGSSSSQASATSVSSSPTTPLAASGNTGAVGAAQTGAPDSGAVEGFKVAGGLVAVVAGLIGAVAAL
ncbi:hypothetical protein JCM8202_002172 [Rhodotorula sphaerocarpa]